MSFPVLSALKDIIFKPFNQMDKFANNDENTYVDSLIMVKSLF